MTNELICDRCRAGHCYDCEGYCWHGCVTDEYDPDQYDPDDDGPSEGAGHDL